MDFIMIEPQYTDGNLMIHYVTNESREEAALTAVKYVLQFYPGSVIVDNKTMILPNTGKAVGCIVFTP